uniref:Carboxypeptidase O n=1 Tax=Sphaeramia orbicularis TaxID=375764 RepID=A0A673B9S1_9TELE
HPISHVSELGNFLCSPPINHITNWMDQIVKENPDVVTKVDYGKTYENRTISLLKIGSKSASAKKAIWMDCGIHAREWIAPAFCQYFINQVKDRKWNFIITQCPDSGNPIKEALLLTLDSHCSAVGISFDCCSNIYPGKSAVSEPEAQAVTNFVGKRADEILCFLTIHSYGQLLLIPYGHPNVIAPNENELVHKHKNTTIDLVHILQNPQSILHNINILIFSTDANSGSSRDWARLQGIPFAFTFELRDDGTYGFKLPEDQIQPACEEAYSGALHIITHVHDKEFIKPTGTAATVAATLWTTMMAVFVTSTVIV